LNADGSLDTTFNPGTNAYTTTVLAQPDGKIVAGGNFTTAAGVARNYIARFNEDGSLDTFNPNANNTVYALAQQPDGKILVGGLLELEAAEQEERGEGGQGETKGKSHGSPR
jgi:hypothetical protein